MTINESLIYPVSVSSPIHRVNALLYFFALLISLVATEILSIEIALFYRCVVWIIFFYICYKSNLLTHFSHIQWFLLMIGIGFSPICFLYFFFNYLRPEYLSWGPLLPYTKPDLLLITNDIILTFTIVSIGVYFLFSDKNDSKKYQLTKSTKNAQSFFKIGVVLFCIGYCFLLLLPIVPASFSQLFGILSSLSQISFCLILLSIVIEYHLNDRLKINKIIFLISAIIFYGITGFILNKGQKGFLFNIILVMIFFSFTYFRYSFLKMLLIVSLITIPFFYFLPFLLSYKTVAHNNEIRSDLEPINNSVEELQLGTVDNHFDLAVLYITIRVIMGTVTCQYVDHYLLNTNSNFIGAGIISQAPEGLIPKFIYPDKPNFDQLYNSLARESGVGAYNDTETSRKPNLFEEGIAVAGWYGVIALAIVFGLFLRFLNYIASYKNRINNFGLFFIFGSLFLSQFPYFAALLSYIFIIVPTYYLVTNLFLYFPFRLIKQ